MSKRVSSSSKNSYESLPRWRKVGAENASEFNNENSLVLEDGRNVDLFSSPSISTGCIRIEM